MVDKHNWALCDYKAETAWTGSDTYFTGLDIDHWEDQIWVLHKAFINDQMSGELSYDEVEKSLPDVDSTEFDKQLNEKTVNSGICLGFTDLPDPPWRSITWAEIAEKHNFSLKLASGNSGELVPGFRCFPFSSWPTNMIAPSMGSLDLESFAVIAELLSVHSALCFAFYGVLDSRCYRGDVSDLGYVIEGERFTPNNIWPEDKSWFVYTDYDLMGTKISGTKELVDEIRANKDLETIEVGLST